MTRRVKEPDEGTQDHRQDGEVNSTRRTEAEAREMTNGVQKEGNEFEPKTKEVCKHEETNCGNEHATNEMDVYAMIETRKARSHSEVPIQDIEEELETGITREDETSTETKNKTEELMEETWKEAGVEAKGDMIKRQAKNNEKNKTEEVQEHPMQASPKNGKTKMAESNDEYDIVPNRMKDVLDDRVET